MSSRCARSRPRRVSHTSRLLLFGVLVLTVALAACETPPAPVEPVADDLGPGESPPEGEPDVAEPDTAQDDEPGDVAGDDRSDAGAGTVVPTPPEPPAGPDRPSNPPRSVPEPGPRVPAPRYRGPDPPEAAQAGPGRPPAPPPRTALDFDGPEHRSVIDRAPVRLTVAGPPVPEDLRLLVEILPAQSVDSALLDYLDAVHRTALSSRDRAGAPRRPERDPVDTPDAPPDEEEAVGNGPPAPPTDAFGGPVRPETGPPPRDDAPAAAPPRAPRPETPGRGVGSTDSSELRPPAAPSRRLLPPADAAEQRLPVPPPAVPRPDALVRGRPQSPPRTGFPTPAAPGQRPGQDGARPGQDVGTAGTGAVRVALNAGPNDVSLAGALDGASYLYRLLLLDPSGDVSEKTPLRLVTLDFGLGEAVPLRPADGRRTIDSGPLLEFSYPGSSLVRIEVSPNPRFEPGPELYRFGPTSTGSEGDTSRIELPAGATGAVEGEYFWRVRPLTESGVLGSFGPSASFVFDTGLVAEPTVYRDGDTTIDLDPVVSWSPVEGASTYEVEVAGEPAVELSSTSYRFPVAGNPGDRVSWRVRALSNNGDRSSWAGPFEVELGSLPLPHRQVLAPGGRVEVRLGSEDGQPDERPVVTREWSRPFAASAFELTNAQVVFLLNRAIRHGTAEIDQAGVRSSAGRLLLGLGDLDYGTQFGISSTDDVLTAVPGRQNHPAVGVTWYGALHIANELSLLRGMDAVYDQEGRWDRTGIGYRLPTEVEWVLVAAGEAGRPYPWGFGFSSERANYFRSFDPFEEDGPTTPVGFYNGAVRNGYRTLSGASPEGVHDLLGNVWEWCYDAYEEAAYASELGMTPEEGELRVLRGGAWNTRVPDLRIANRGSFPAEGTSFSIGVRLVLDHGDRTQRYIGP